MGTISSVSDTISVGACTEKLTFGTDDGRTIGTSLKCNDSCCLNIGATVRISYRPSDLRGARNLDSGCKSMTWLYFQMGGHLPPEFRYCLPCIVGGFNIQELASQATII